MCTHMLSLENYDDVYVNQVGWVWIRIGLNELGLGSCWVDGQSYLTKLYCGLGILIWAQSKFKSPESNLVQFCFGLYRFDQPKFHPRVG